nr:clathrin light chain a [Hymenolepis microstoma]
MDDFTSAFLSRGRDELKDVEEDISYAPFGVDSSKTMQPNTSASHQFQSADTEPESVTRWRQEYSANIEKKDGNEAEKVNAMKENAEKELVDWQAWYKKNLVKAHQENLAHEEELQSQRDKTTLLSQSVANVNPSDSAIWERVCQLCDLTVSSTGDSTFSSKSSSQFKDITRFRSLLLSLKNNPPRISH